MKKGDINVYVCEKCRARVVTVDAEDGVTPFMISCKATKGCKGMMFSSGYRVDQTLKPQFEWYRPSIDQYPEEAREYMRHHIDNGGLDIRPYQRRGFMCDYIEMRAEFNRLRGYCPIVPYDHKGERFDMVKCPWRYCSAGMGLAGAGRCLLKGIWWHPSCPMFEGEEYEE